MDIDAIPRWARQASTNSTQPTYLAVLLPQNRSQGISPETQENIHGWCNERLVGERRGYDWLVPVMAGAGAVHVLRL